MNEVLSITQPIDTLSEPFRSAIKALLASAADLYADGDESRIEIKVSGDKSQVFLDGVEVKTPPLASSDLVAIGPECDKDDAPDWAQGPGLSDADLRYALMGDLRRLFEEGGIGESDRYGQIDGYSFYMCEGEQLPGLPIICYAHVTDEKAIVLSVYGHWVEIPANMFHEIWPRKDDGK